MIKGYISSVLRNTGLLAMADKSRFYIQKFKNRQINSDFKRHHPEVKLPPDYLMYESFQLNYHKYFTESRNTAIWLKDCLKKHISLEHLKILDWGCGPGRVIRHLPEVINHSCKFFGTDYNERSILWCTQNLPGIQFNLNTLEPVLPYTDNYFDVIFGLSIFTHLSEKLHYDWSSELLRVLKPGGLLLLTTQGDNFKVKLTAQELQQFNSGKLVTRGKVKEGHRIYSSFDPDPFMHKLFNKHRVLEVIKETPQKGFWLPQDTWIIKKCLVEMHDRASQ
jgi:SAM-dependent methyltransferase